MTGKTKKVLIYVLPTMFALTILAAGFFLGAYYSSLAVRVKLNEYQKGETLGSLLTEEEIAGISQAYHDPERAAAQMDEITWSVANTMAPFVGSAPEPGVHQNALINSMQMRREAELVSPKHQDTYRIFLLGGSTAFGSGAPDQDSTVSAYLERFLNERQGGLTGMTFEVINFANPAWASTHERIIIENRIHELQPDMVIALSGNNDVHWGFRGQNSLWLRTYAEDLQRDILNIALVGAGSGPMPEVITPDPGSVPVEKVVERLLHNVQLSAYALSLDNTPYVFFLQPTIDVTQKPLTEREAKLRDDTDRQEYFSETYQEIDAGLSQLDDKNVHYFNLASIFDELPQEDLFIDSYHFGDKGYELIAEAMYSRIAALIEK